MRLRFAAAFCALDLVRLFMWFSSVALLQTPALAGLLSVCVHPVPQLAVIGLDQLHLFSNVPLITTRIVRETSFPFCERLQVCSPADIAPLTRTFVIKIERNF